MASNDDGVTQLSPPSSLTISLAAQTSAISEGRQAMSTDRPRVTIPSSHAHLSDNRFSRLIPSQRIANVDTFELEEGTVLQNVQVAFKTWGKLNARRDNAMVICHALTGSADVEDWCVTSHHALHDAYKQAVVARLQHAK